MRLAEIEFEGHGGAVVARLTGELDLSNVEEIRGAIADAMPNHILALVLDLSAIDYLDSSGIQLIYRLREDLRTRGQGLRLVIPPGSPSQAALRLAGVEASVETLPTVADALAALGELG
jgi:anti-sigma B factor antagonist